MMALLEIAVPVVAGAVTAGVTVLPALYFYHNTQKRKEGANDFMCNEHRKRTDAQWGALDRHAGRISELEKNLAVLRSKIDDLPNETDVRGFIDALEIRLDQRFTRLENQIQALFDRGHM